MHYFNVLLFLIGINTQVFYLASFLWPHFKWQNIEQHVF